jgi:hypothetical protein
VPQPLSGVHRSTAGAQASSFEKTESSIPAYFNRQDWKNIIAFKKNENVEKARSHFRETQHQIRISFFAFTEPFFLRSGRVQLDASACDRTATIPSVYS